MSLIIQPQIDLNELWMLRSCCSRLVPQFPSLGKKKSFICQPGNISQCAMWKMARVSRLTYSPAGNNPEITCRDEALMILLMKKPGLSSAATDWKEPGCVQCNGPGPDNPSESMQSMRPPIRSWNVRGCHVWHLPEHWLGPNMLYSDSIISLIFSSFETRDAFQFLLGHLSLP